MAHVLLILAAMVGLEALIFVAFPETAKSVVAALSPSEIRIAGTIELAVAVAAIYFALSAH